MAEPGLTAAMIANPLPAPRAERPEAGTDPGGVWDGPQLILTPEFRRLAGRCVPSEPPGRAIADVPRFAAHVLTFGTVEDCAVLRGQLPDDLLPAVLDAAPPGVFDARSWAYWNLVAGRGWRSCPPLPARTFGG